MYKCCNFFVFLTLFIVNKFPSRTEAFRLFEVNGVETILAMENEDISIECKTDEPLDYCGFIHKPTRKRYSFSGPTLDGGRCVIKRKASYNDSGEWKCYLGTRGTRVQLMYTIQVRIVDQVAAIQKNITGVLTKPVTLECATTIGDIPLSYCRFEPPNGQPFSIDTYVTVFNPVLGRYYFPENKSLDRGDCAVTIRQVDFDDAGIWTCGAGFEDGKEHIDTIGFEVAGIYTMLSASTTGITLGSIGSAALITILGIIVWKKRRYLGTLPPEIVLAPHELEPLPTQESAHRMSHFRRNVPVVIVESPSDSSATPSGP